MVRASVETGGTSSCGCRFPDEQWRFEIRSGAGAEEDHVLRDRVSAGAGALFDREIRRIYNALRSLPTWPVSCTGPA